jgi:hypothetical protein
MRLIACKVQRCIGSEKFVMAILELCGLGLASFSEAKHKRMVLFRYLIEMPLSTPMHFTAFDQRVRKVMMFFVSRILISALR